MSTETCSISEYMRTMQTDVLALPHPVSPFRCPLPLFFPSLYFSMRLKHTFLLRGSEVTHLHVKCEPADIPRQP